eukprot:TRINITY_DN11394_c0_g1_i1.p1 TRINITY_DN11394_c0_g1~~TRINITY_DN11394_c0_g1_i1.p1  ORF type:complete len:109 (+),score=16.31 TRINITY_DN11394_c0_g1_i1:1-327(+)
MQCHVFLFNDLLLWGLPDKKSHLIPKDRVKLAEALVNKHEPYSVSFYTFRDPQKYKGFSIEVERTIREVFYTTDNAEVLTWLEILKECIYKQVEELREKVLSNYQMKK